MKTTPFYHCEVTAGAKMTTAGVSLPTEFVDAVEEHKAIRERVGINDFSAMGEIDIKGPDARKFLDEHFVNNVAGLKPGRIVYTTLLNENAEIIDDTTIYCFSDEHFWVITSAPRRMEVLNWLTAESEGKAVYVTDISARIGLLAVQGPKSKDMLSPLVKEVNDLKYFGFVKTMVADIPALVSRTGFTGELGFEILVDADDACHLWEMLEEAGKEYGCMFCGTIAGVFSIPLEKGLITIREYGDNRNPLEVGLGWTVKWEKPYFVGKEKLEVLKNEGTKEMLVGFVADDAEANIPLGSTLIIDGVETGKVTSCHFGHTVGKKIGLCFVPASYANVGNKIQIKTESGIVGATIADKTFFDPERLRIKGIY